MGIKAQRGATRHRGLQPALAAATGLYALHVTLGPPGEGGQSTPPPPAAPGFQELAEGAQGIPVATSEGGTLACLGSAAASAPRACQERESSPGLGSGTSGRISSKGRTAGAEAPVRRLRVPGQPLRRCWVRPGQCGGPSQATPPREAHWSKESVGVDPRVPQILHSRPLQRVCCSLRGCLGSTPLRYMP